MNLIVPLVLLLLNGEFGWAANFYFSPWENGYRKDSLLFDNFEMDTLGSSQLTVNMSMAALSFLLEQNQMGAGFGYTPNSKRKCKTTWVPILGYQFDWNDRKIIDYHDLVRPDGRCGANWPAPGTNRTPAGCDPTSVNKCCSSTNQCGTDCSCPGCISYEAVHAARVQRIYKYVVTSLGDCANKCLQSAACDVFFYNGGSCIFMPYIKIKTLTANQVFVPGNIYAKEYFVQECDDSQGNVLSGNDWEGGTPPSPWTQTLENTAISDTYLTYKQTLYFRGLLPACPVGWNDYNGVQCIFNSQDINLKSEYNLWNLCRSWFYSTPLAIEDSSKLNYLRTILFDNGTSPNVNCKKPEIHDVSLLKYIGPHKDCGFPGEFQYGELLSWWTGGNATSQSWEYNNLGYTQPSFTFAQTLWVPGAPFQPLSGQDAKEKVAFIPYAGKIANVNVNIVTDLWSVCQAKRDITSLGGAADGYYTEHSVAYSGSTATQSVQVTIGLADTGLSASYISTFSPNGLIKFWARSLYGIDDVVNGLTVSAQLRLNSGTIITGNSVKVLHSSRSKTIPILIAVTPLPLDFPMTLTVSHTNPTVHNNTFMYSPIELILDLPIYLGCYKMAAGDNVTRLSSAQDCLVYCSNISSRFAVMGNGTQCGCLSEINHDNFVEVARSSCNVPCSDSSDYMCGGTEAFSLFVAECEKGFQRFGSRCFQNVGQTFPKNRDLCFPTDSELFTPKYLGDEVVIPKLFSVGQPWFATGILWTSTTSGFTLMDRSWILGYYPVYYGSFDYVMNVQPDPVPSNGLKRPVILNGINGSLSQGADNSIATLICEKPIVSGYGNKSLIGSNYVNYKIYDSGVEYARVEESILPGSPGIPISIHGLRGSWSKTVEIRLNQSVVLNAILLTYDYTAYLKSVDLLLPHFVSDKPDQMRMQEYPIAYRNDSTMQNPLRKMIKLDYPTVLDRFKMQFSTDGNDLDMRIELFGLLKKDVLPPDYFELGDKTATKRIITSNSTIPLAGQICPNGGIHLSGLITVNVPTTAVQGLTVTIWGPEKKEHILVSVLFSSVLQLRIGNESSPAVNINPQPLYGQTLHLYITCMTEKFQVFVNNYLQGEYNKGSASNCASITVGYVSAIANAWVLEQVYYDKSKFIAPTATNRIGCIGGVCTRVLPGQGKLLQAYMTQHPGTTQHMVNYLTAEPVLSCHRTPIQNVKCNNLGMAWRTSYIPALFSACTAVPGNILIGSQCVRVVNGASNYLAANTDCQLNYWGRVAPPTDEIQTTLLGVYAQEKTIGSFWVGAQNINGSWIKSTGRRLSKYEINLVNNETEGDCIISDASVNYKHRAVPCGSSFPYFCVVSPNCPDNYTWVPKLRNGRTCVKIGERPGPGVQSPDYISGAKLCARDNTRLASPYNKSEIDQLQKWLNKRSFEQIEDFDVLLGWRRYTPTSGNEYFVSSFNGNIGLIDFMNIFGEFLKSTPLVNATFRLGPASSISPQLKQMALFHWVFRNTRFNGLNEPDVRVLCQYTECLTVDNRTCNFPFRYKGRMYDTCITIDSPDSVTPWCSLATDPDYNHIEGDDNVGLCGSTCFVQNCPVGFDLKLGNCYHLSARTKHDTVTSWAEANSICSTTGSRLYQPRDWVNWNNLANTEKEYILPTAMQRGHYADSSANSGLAFGAYVVSLNPLKVMYFDNTQAYWVEYWISIVGQHSFTISPLVLTNKTACITVNKWGHPRIELCNGYSTSFRNGYICEAKPMKTIGGPDPEKQCVFPFKVTDTGGWNTSCYYDPVRGSPWCPTQVDSAGVAVADKWGFCSDERVIAYDGPGSGKYCITPFLHNRVWYDKCPMDSSKNLWCPTRMNSTNRMFNESIDQIGFCTQYLAPNTADCSPHYDKVGGTCIRVSAFAETFDNAISMCSQEGSYLVTISDKSKMLSIPPYIQSLITTRQYFKSTYSPDLTAYWVGGTFKSGLWTWLSNGKNFTVYSNWIGGRANEGCLLNSCTDKFGLTLFSSKAYAWKAMERAVAKPYICENKCPAGYAWYTTAKKCLKVVDNTNEATLRSAFYQCAKDNARLTDFKTCTDVSNLAEDIWNRNPSTNNTYWVGYFYTSGYYSTSRRTEKNRLQWKTLSSTGYLGVIGCPKIISPVSDQSKGYLSFTSASPSSASIRFLEELIVDDNNKKGYICEIDSSWSCPPGYLLFQEHCYIMYNDPKTFVDAQLNCSLNNGYLVKIEHVFNYVFLLNLMNMSSNTPVIWTGFRRNILGNASMYHIFDMTSKASYPSAVPSGTGDCVVLALSTQSFLHTECTNQLPYVCQTSQSTNPDLIAKMGLPDYVHPLDNVTETSDETFVGFSDTAVLQTELLRPASFIMSSARSSRITENGPVTIDGSQGLTIGMWVKINSRGPSEYQWLLNVDNQFFFYFGPGSVLIFVCNTLGGSWPSCSHTFFESHISLPLQTWIYVAFTYSASTSMGTLYINDTFGTSSLGEGTYFSLSNTSWIKSYHFNNNIQIGSQFFGEMSCLQIFNKELEPAQVYQMSKVCYLNETYPRSKACPPGFEPGVSLPLFCTKVSDQPLTYSQAEVFCQADPNLPYTSNVAYSSNLQVLQTLSAKAMQKLNVTAIYIGLDSQSVHPAGSLWTDSYGRNATKIPWATNQPSSSGLCAVLDYSLGMKIRTVNCSEQFYFFCEGNIYSQPPCPLDHFYYKGNCIYQSMVTLTLPQAKQTCAARGGFLLPIKTIGMYHFLQAYSSQDKFYTFTDFMIGLNLTSSMYSDNTTYTSQSYDLDGDNVKFQGFQCALLKEGIGYKARGFDCQTPFQFFCLWINLTCPDGFLPYPAKADGRSCYRLSQGTGQFSTDQCTVPGNKLRRMALPANISAIGFIQQPTSFIWIDGTTWMDFYWAPQSVRIDTFNNSAAIVDTYKHRSWITAEKEKMYYVENQVPEAIVRLAFKQSMCTTGGKMALVLVGNFSKNRLTTPAGRPTLRFRVDKNNFPMRWSFLLGGSNASGPINSFSMGAVVNTTVLPVQEKQMPGSINPLQDFTFNLTITCDSGFFYATFNDTWNDKFKFNAALLPNITDIQILGGITVIKAGYTGQGCLSLAPNGRVVPGYNADCQELLPTVCEHEWCYTTEGFKCIFPFTYKNVAYNECISFDVFQPWCPTVLSVTGAILYWGFCLDDCPYQDAPKSCLSPPPLPAFGALGTAETNYNSTWFKIQNNQNSYNISSVKTRLHRPTWFYDGNNKTDNVTILVTNNQLDFSPLYSILDEGANVTYTCPFGNIFSDSNNISFVSSCTNGNWTTNFNTSAACVPVFCTLTIPGSPVNTTNATTNVADLMKNDPDWNSFSKNITYTCPEGFVVETVGSDTEQDQGIISFLVRCDADRYWRPVLPSSPYPLPPIMPRCIAINCTRAPFQVPSNGLASMTWNEVPGNPRPYATIIVYECAIQGWGYLSNGLNRTVSYCQQNGQWNVTSVENCVRLPCGVNQPPPPPSGPGAWMRYGADTTMYRCQNGYMFNTSEYPLIWGNECLPTRKWSYPNKIIPCIKRNCLSPPPGIPIEPIGIYMEHIWPYSVNELGDSMLYRCPPGKRLDIPLPRGHPNLDGMTFAQYGSMRHPQRDQILKCVWSSNSTAGHNDSMVWLPAVVDLCNGTIPALIPLFCICVYLKNV